MSERWILKKPERRGSLAKRILWGAALFVIFPLFIHTIFLYFRDYQGDVKTVAHFLEIVGRDKQELLEEIIEKKKQLLGELSLSHLHPQVEKIPQDPSGSPFFTKVDAEKHLLWVGKNESSTEAIGSVIHLDDWMQKWSYLQKYEYPLFVSIEDLQGTLVAGESLGPNEKELVSERPILDTGLVLRLSVPLRAIEQYELRYYAFSAFTLLVLIGLLGGGGVILFARRVAKPFDALCRTMERVSEGAIHVRYQPDKMGFEINALGEQFNQTLDELLTRTQEAERERIHREQLAQELKIGRHIQQSLLPSHLPVFSGIDIAPGYLPAQEVSGDFYDFFPIDEDRFLFVVADCAGKGISACLYGLGFRSSLRAFASAEAGLSQIVQKANELFMLDAGSSGFFITAWLGLYNAKTSTLEYCSQGHPPALLKRGSAVQELSTHSIAFGVEPFTQPLVQEMTLLPDDLLLLYTDGILEAHHITSQFFGMKRLQDFLRISSFSSSSLFVNSLLSAIEEFSQGTAQYDDITLLMIRFFR
ncbi:MAG: PP2C family protein-serine/threonine phosphatase [Chlamydiales bacterium]|nr:PP2C family protein-serine/threonine phosphatase [Chlamydiales bacterium]